MQNGYKDRGTAFEVVFGVFMFSHGETKDGRYRPVFTTDSPSRKLFKEKQEAMRVAYNISQWMNTHGVVAIDDGRELPIVRDGGRYPKANETFVCDWDKEPV